MTNKVAIPTCVGRAALRRRQLAAVLGLLGRGAIAYHPKLVGISGGVAPALMLSQALYWTRVLALGDRLRDGWFWKTQADWQQETALSRHEQSTARRRLLQHPFWLEQRRGMPARIWFRLDLAALARTLDAQFSGDWDWSDRQQLIELLGRPLVVYRSLAALCDSVTGAILLSRLLAELRLADRRTHDASSRASQWYPLQPSNMMAITGLSRAEFYRARRQLRGTSVLQELRQGLPPQAFWQLDLAHLATLLQASLPAAEFPCDAAPSLAASQFAGNDTISSPESRHKSAEIRRQECEKPQTVCTESGKQILRNPANKIAGFEPPRLPDSGFPYMGLTTGLQTTVINPPPTPSPDPASDGHGVGGGSPMDSLVWPIAVFLPEELAVAQAMLDAVPTHAQVVLDELAGQIANGVVRSPLAYLRRLTLQAQQGNFVPLLAARVADRRARGERLRAANAARTEAVQRAAAEQTPMSLSLEQRALRLATLRELRSRLPSTAADRNGV